MALQETLLKPQWAIPDIIDSKKPGYIDGPHKASSPTGSHEITYARYPSYVDDAIQERVDFTQEKLGLRSHLTPPNHPDAIGIKPEIMSITRNYLPDGSIKEYITIPFVIKNDHACFEFAQYDSDGNLVLSDEGMLASNPIYRDQAINAGHFTAETLPDRIDFTATIQAFLVQIDGPEEHRFDQPKLIPVQETTT